VAIYDKLQPMALHVGDIGGHPLGRYRAYEFPAVWAQALREDVFTPEDDEAGDEPRGLPLWAVTNAISTLMPQVLTNDARGLARTTWLAWNTVANGPAPVERRGDGVLAPARVRQQEQHPLSVVLYPAPERADPAVRPFPADPRPRRIRRWARSPVFDAERAIGVHLLSPSPWPITPHPSGSPVSSGTKAGAARAAIWTGMTTWPDPGPADHPGPPAGRNRRPGGAG